MPKKVLPSGPDQIWHVYSRGVRKVPIFVADDDRETFLDMLDWAVRKTAMDLFCYCLMTNHYHLELRGSKDQLSDCMQRVNWRYAREFNFRVDVNGHLFQGSYEKHPAPNLAWAFDRSLYIHMNPVEAGMVADPYDYPWSSLPAFTGGTYTGPTLSPSPLLAPLGETFEDQAKMYAQALAHAMRQASPERNAYRIIEERNGHRPSFDPVRKRLEMYESCRLIRSVEAYLGASDLDLDTRQLWTRLLVAAASRRQNPVTDEALAIVMGMSTKTIPNLRRKAVRLAEADTQYRKLSDLFFKESTF